MAIFNPGPAVGQISGRIGGSVFSRNRGGAYIRNGAIPTASTTPYATAAKARMSDFSKLWADLTSVQQMAWKNWATQNPITNRLGNQVTLSGHGAFVQLNIVISIAGGTLISDPPVVAPPSALTTFSATYDIGAGSTELTFTPDPLGADECLEIRAAVSDNPGVNYVENLYKQLGIAGPNLGSPVDYSVSLESRFGTLMVGQKVFFKCRVVDSTTGLKSGWSVANGVIIST